MERFGGRNPPASDSSPSPHRSPEFTDEPLDGTGSNHRPIHRGTCRRRQPLVETAISSPLRSAGNRLIEHPEQPPGDHRAEGYRYPVVRLVFKCRRHDKVIAQSKPLGMLDDTPRVEPPKHRSGGSIRPTRPVSTTVGTNACASNRFGKWSSQTHQKRLPATPQHFLPTWCTKQEPPNHHLDRHRHCQRTGCR